MPLLRPVPRPRVDWLTGEIRTWQSEGWLEAQHAEELLRPRRRARRQHLDVLVDDLVDAVASGARVVGDLVARCAGALSRPRPRG